MQLFSAYTKQRIKQFERSIFDNIPKILVQRIRMLKNAKAGNFLLLFRFIQFDLDISIESIYWSVPAEANQTRISEHLVFIVD